MRKTQIRDATGPASFGGTLASVSAMLRYLY